MILNFCDESVQMQIQIQILVLLCARKGVMLEFGRESVHICIFTDMSDVSGENCVMVELSRESAQIQIQIWVILCEVRMVRWWT